MKTFVFYVPSMHCASCVARIQKYFDDQSGISVKINLAEKQVLIEGTVSEIEAQKQLEKAGFPGETVISQEAAIQQKEANDQKELSQKKRDAYLTLGFGIPMMIWGMFDHQTVVNEQNQVTWIILGMITLFLLIFSGRHFFQGAIRSLVRKSANMDTLIALGTGSAWLYSALVSFFPQFFPIEARHVYFEASMMIVGLINLGQSIELKARKKTNTAIHQLIGLQPTTAIRVTKKGDEEVHIHDLQVGDQLRLQPGARVALDGKVIQGQSFIDESMLTGEPIPIEKIAGSGLSAGTINKNGSIIYEVTKTKQETKLAKIIELVQEAQVSKIAIGRLADRVAFYFVPTVISIAVISSVIWLAFGGQQNIAHALVVFISVLIIACPCALGLATPLSIMVSVGRAAKMGVLIKNGEALQTASHVDCIVFDKTGTLTQGTPSITDYVVFDDNINSEQLFIAIASLEKHSEHPLSQAVINDLKENTALKEPSYFENHPGKGITGNIEEDLLYVGNQSLMEKLSIELPENIKQRANQFMGEAKSVVFVACNQKAIALLAISDPIKEDAFELINSIKKQNLHPVLMSGDNLQTVQYIANQLGIDEFYAQMLPDQKQVGIQTLQKKGEIVAMIGDGINDAAAIASADIGIAMGTGTDIAIESADFTLLSERIQPISNIFSLAKKTLINIKQNLFFSFLYNVLGIPLAAGVFYPFTGWLLSPMVAGLAMALSSITVVSNANRLRTQKLD